jgi:hypothetical protein
VPQGDGKCIEVWVQRSVARGEVSVGKKTVKRGERLLPVVSGDVAPGSDTQDEEDQTEEPKPTYGIGCGDEAIKAWTRELAQTRVVDGHE